MYVSAGTLPPEDELASSAWHDAAAAAASPPANAQSSSEHSQHGGSSGGDSGGHISNHHISHHHHQQQHQNQHQHPLRPMAVNGFGRGAGGGVRGSASQQQFLFEQQQQQQQGQHGQAGPSPARELSLRCSPDIDESRFKCKGAARTRACRDGAVDQSQLPMSAFANCEVSVEGLRCAPHLGYSLSVSVFKQSWNEQVD